MVVENPFLNRVMIKNPDEFFGRKNELRAIFSRLSNLQSSDVYGERKIGKSSLLYYIFLKIPEKLGNDYKIAYIDLQGAECQTVEGFLRYCLREVGLNPEVINPSNSHNKNLMVFSESVRELRKKNKPVLLIDEFERIIKRPEFDNDFFDTMRSLGNNGDIAYVTASLHSLKTLCIEGHFTSPLYNIFSEVPLGLLSPEETIEFLSAKREGIEFTEKEIEFIKEIANNNPLHLQIACYHVFENKRHKWDEKKLRKKIEKEFKNFDDKWARKERGIIKGGKSLFNWIKERTSIEIGSKGVTLNSSEKANRPK
ncbi:ATPase [Candidatus Methanoperedens nitroreducens]|uniref:ATPase n=1 Tax=Candidatus Methanoperedens nitratireducens TaxID=1392998 RepID=A0A062VAR8_9EURY|nr:AAA-like domain-containing protein [Candidatus Methanoperedens nitroreducens]KCZ72415.1 ATPase [Candidatus Methanoperedens nitroreducens]MDJ1423651.1 AAA-like domain-containing protein [Candidatus Methanoperedens sp.]